MQVKVLHIQSLEALFEQDVGQCVLFVFAISRKRYYLEGKQVKLLHKGSLVAPFGRMQSTLYVCFHYGRCLNGYRSMLMQISRQRQLLGEIWVNVTCLLSIGALLERSRYYVYDRYRHFEIQVSVLHGRSLKQCRHCFATSLLCCFVASLPH